MYQSIRIQLTQKELLEICKKIIVSEKSLRSLSEEYGVSKSYLHYTLHKRIPLSSLSLYNELTKALKRNYIKKHIKGGLATKRKWERINKIN